MTVAELGRRMSSREFSEWQEFAELEPFGPLADGAAAAVLLNVNRDRKARPDPFSTLDALRMFAFDPPEPQPVDLAAKLKAAFGSLGRGRRGTGKRKA